MKRSPYRYTPHAQRSDSSRACTRAESRRRLGLAFIIGVISSAATSITVTDATAQGRSSYLNFETPQVKPITVARIGGRDWLLCCNTPDNSLEIYDCETNGRIDRIAVGLEPVSVKWNAALSRAYTTNMVGDSVSVISLTVNAQGRLVPRLDRTEWVGDEPMDIEFSADGLQCFVTLHTAGAIAWLDAFTLKPFLPGTGKVTIVDSWSQATKSIKEPRRIQRIGSRL
ncbi:MAG TPA: hypothetical protein PKE00_17040, partial [Planctomycetota bacterium]|nr:hypothetical protein [Planctomycetota bacterium]